MRRLRLFLLLIPLLLGLGLVACDEGAEETEVTEVPAVVEETPEEESAPATATAEPAPTAEEEVVEEEAAPGDEEEAIIEDVPQVEEAPLYLAIIWHQHQPVYYKDPETGVYAKPWVRLHATKDYVDMAAMLEEYPDIHATFNLTPSLLRQLDDLAAGAKDLYWVYAEVPADELTAEQQQFILDRFFDTNRKIVARFPRYQELLDKRDSSEAPLAAYTTQDFRDLQVLFNLAWTDPAWLAEEPLAALVEQGSDFQETDKEVLFAEHQRLIEAVVPLHRRLQEAGQIEVTMTPFAHPILPLLVTTDLARQALPEADLPRPPFVFGQDAQAQVELGVELYQDHFGQAPRGMWPAEGSVAEEIVSMVAQNGIGWMASDEGVLAKSLGLGSFTRNAEDTVQEADLLYRPYYVQGRRGGPVAMVFRDVVISDKVGFTYSGMPGDRAAQDFVDRIHNIRQQLLDSGEPGPHLVSVILDGENAWEHYDNDGKLFLHTLYRLLSEDELIRTVTPTEYLQLAPDQPRIEELWAGSWIGADFSTWIGEEEENKAWDYLRDTRTFLQPYLVGAKEAPSAEALAEAQTLMYIAEGSDWFWWYGSDQNSGDDSSFDEQFRATLRQIYTLLEVEPPLFVEVPIIPEQPVAADQPLTGLIEPTIDGIIEEGEWAAAGRYQAAGGAMAAAEPVFESVAYGFDSSNFYLNFDLSSDAADILQEGIIELYLSAPGGGAAMPFSGGGTLLGFSANRQIEISQPGGQTQAVMLRAEEGTWETGGAFLDTTAIAGDQIEMAIPLDELGSVDVGANLAMRAIYTEDIAGDAGMELVDTVLLPVAGPALVVVPDLGNVTTVLEVDDPVGDDYGPGSYTYPLGEVFAPGNFDITRFEVGYDEANIIFRFAVEGPLENVWDSPNGLSVQSFDVYIDSAPGGGKAMLPGRNLAFGDDYAWDYAVAIEGWTSAVFVPTEEGGQEEIASAGELFVLADPGQRRVTVRVPKSILGDDPGEWAYAAVALGQEGFPSGGVLRVRDVLETAEEWRFGGAPTAGDVPATNTTRVIDFVWPESGLQAEWLSDITSVDTSQTELTAEDFATVPMIPAESQ